MQRKRMIEEATSKAHRDTCIDVDTFPVQEAEVVNLFLCQTLNLILLFKTLHVNTGDSRSCTSLSI